MIQVVNNSENLDDALFSEDSCLLNEEERLLTGYIDADTVEDLADGFSLKLEPNVLVLVSRRK